MFVVKEDNNFGLFIFFFIEYIAFILFIYSNHR